MMVGMGALLTLGCLGPAIARRPDLSISPEMDMKTRCDHR